MEEEKRNNILIGIQSLGYTEKLANEIIDTFNQMGGSYCYHKWPEEFSLFSSKRNIVDILIENKAI